MLLPSILITPIIGIVVMALVRFAFPKAKNLMGVIFLTTGICQLVLSCFLLKEVLDKGSLYLKISDILWIGGSFFADTLSAILIVLTAFLWVIVAIYASSYMKEEAKSTLFYFSAITTLASVLGIFMSTDFFTFLLFFELMTISSYFWVVHNQDKKAIKAGYYYLFFSITSGLLIALALAIKPEYTSYVSNGFNSVAVTNGKGLNWFIGILIAGFGIKMGMVPLHLWLPRAHSAAPAPASALLSGLIIKIGAYGVIRTLSVVGWENCLNLKWIGFFLLIIGIATMFTGVIAALLQSDAKRLLAYSSVSQMGYIILGLGIASYLGSGGMVALLGVVYHVINHALFKVTLFLGAGIIYHYKKETNLYKLGGLWRSFPFLAFLILIAALAISGAPGLNGYASKLVLHEGLNIAVENGEQWLSIIEKLFNVVGIGTTASFVKFYYLTFIKRPSTISESSNIENKKENRKSTFPMYFAIILICFCMFAIGIKPMLIPELIGKPIVENLGIQLPVGFEFDFSFWSISGILSAFITLLFGTLLSFVGLKTKAFNWRAPRWLTIEGLAIYSYRLFAFTNKKLAEIYNFIIALFSKLKERIKKISYNRLVNFDGLRNYQMGRVVLRGVSADVWIVMLMVILLVAGFSIANLWIYFMG